MKLLDHGTNLDTITKTTTNEWLAVSICMQSIHNYGYLQQCHLLMFDLKSSRKSRF